MKIFIFLIFLSLCVSADSMVAYWDFSDYGNSLTSDQSGNGHHASVYGATHVSDGYSGNAFLLDGIDDGLIVDNHPNLNPSYMSASMWFKPYDLSTVTALMVHRSDFLVGSFFLYLDRDQIVLDTFGSDGFNESGSYRSRWYTGYRASLNQWTHVAFTYDGTARTLYINGSYYDQNLEDLGPNASTTQFLSIGRDSAVDRYFFNGMIDEVSFWNTALNQQEIAGLYACNIVPEPVFLWMFVTGILFFLLRNIRKSR